MSEMSVGSGTFLQEQTSAQDCRKIVNMKTEPDQKQVNEAISIHGGVRVATDPSLALSTDGRIQVEDGLMLGGEGKKSCLRQCLLQKISEESHAKITKIVGDIQSLSDLEMLLLYLSLPMGQSSDSTVNGNIVGSSNPSVHLSNQLEQSQAYTWILSHLEEDNSTCLRKDEVYEDYRSYCDNHSMKCLNTADFGKVMKRAFPNVKPRRLGQRGQSKYCYGGLRKRVEVQPPFLPDLDPLRDDKDPNGGVIGRDGSVSDQNVPPGESMLSECIALVLEWVEKLLGRQFITLRQLAEYLVLNMYVNSRSCAAFALVADVHNRQSQTTAKPVVSSPRINREQRRKSVSSRDSESGPRLPSPRSDTSRVKASGSASSDTSTPPSAVPSSHLQSYSDTPPVPPPSTHLHSYTSTPPTPAPSSRLQTYASTPPAPPSAHINSYVSTPPSSHIHSYANTPPAPLPAVKPNLLQLPSNITPHTAHTSQTTPLATSIPMRAFPNYPSVQTPYTDSYRPPPPLQYGGGTYTPQRVGKRPYETTTHEYYSPYYPYPENNPKRSRYDAGTQPYGQQQLRCQAVPLQHQYSANPGYSQRPQQQYQQPPGDPYSGLGMLSPRSYAAQQQTQSQAAPPTRYSLGPRLGPSPGPSGGTPRVGRSPSPLRFTSGPPTTGVRRPSPIRGSPGTASSQESPESGSSIHLPPVSLPRSPTSPFRVLPKKTQKMTNAGSNVRSTSREFDFPDGAPTSSNFHTSSPEEQKVTSTTVATPAEALCGFAEATRNTDLHTPTPPSATDYLFVDTSAQPGTAGGQRSSGLTPPSALL